MPQNPRRPLQSPAAIKYKGMRYPKLRQRSRYPSPPNRTTAEPSVPTPTPCEIIDLMRKSRRGLIFALIPGISARARTRVHRVDALLQIQRISEPAAFTRWQNRRFLRQHPGPELLTRSSTLSGQSRLPAAASPTTHHSGRSPRWSPDGKRIYYTGGNRRGVANLEHQSGWHRPETNHPPLTGASGELISPDGKHLIVTSDVYPDCGADDACNQRKIDDAKQSKTQATSPPAFCIAIGTPGRAIPAATSFRSRSTTTRPSICHPAIASHRPFLWTDPTTTRSLPIAPKSPSRKMPTPIRRRAPTTKSSSSPSREAPP